MERWGVEGHATGGLILAGDLLVACDQGEILIFRPDPERFDLVMRQTVLPGKCWTAPVVAGGRIYARNAVGRIVALAPAPLLEPPGHELDFSTSEPGPVPQSVFVSDGSWRLAKSGDRVALEHAPLPLADGEVQLGPTLREGAARIAVEVALPGSGRRQSSQAAIGLHGPAGYRLRLHRGAGRIELLKSWQTLATAEVPETDSEHWHLELEVIPATEAGDGASGGDPNGGVGWRVAARAWATGEPRPEMPQLQADGPPEPLSGRATLRSTPFSGEPVRFYRVRIWDSETGAAAQ